MRWIATYFDKRKQSCDLTRKQSYVQAQLLGRQGVYDAGHTPGHMTIKLGREELLATTVRQRKEG